MKVFTIFFFIAVAAVSAQLSVQSTADQLTPEDDVRRLQNAMEALASNEQIIIDILVHRSADERRMIDDMFRTMYTENFTSTINSELSGDFRDASLALMTPLPTFNAHLVYRMLHSLRGCLATVTEVLAPLNNDDIKALSAVYGTLGRFNLTTEVTHYTFSGFRHLLQSILAANRTEDTNVDEGVAKEDAESLFQVGESQGKANQTVFNQILTTRSYPQLRRIFDVYQNISGYSLEKTIERKFSADVKEGLLALVKVAQNKAVYFAERLQVALAKKGINNPSLVRLIMSRGEVDVAEIKDAYKKMYGTSLGEDITIKASAGYRRLLLALIDHPTSPGSSF